MRSRLLLLLLPLLAAAAAPPAAPEAATPRQRERELMTLTVASMAASAGIAEARRLDPDVLAALRATPRHLFVPDDVRAAAYGPTALPIGHGQTISQPYIVALMTHLLALRRDHKVLEVGTGSGYQAAILARLADEVRSIEIVAPLARDAAERLRTLGHRNVTVRTGDGYRGWPEAAPFDRIIVTAGAAHLPQPLVDQLKPGGRMVIPLARGGEEMLTVIDKDARGRLRRRALIPVRFVPLVRE